MELEAATLALAQTCWHQMEAASLALAQTYAHISCMSVIPLSSRCYLL